jgi:hypothetical protein
MEPISPAWDEYVIGDMSPREGKPELR